MFIVRWYYRPHIREAIVVMMAVRCTIWVRRSVQDVYGFFHYVLSLYIIKVCYTVSFTVLWYYFIIEHIMPPKKYTMDELDKIFDEKPGHLNMI